MGKSRVILVWYELNASVGVDLLKFIKLEFGANVGESVTSGKENGVQSTLFLQENQCGVSWRRCCKEQQKGDIIQRDKFGNETYIDYVLVDDISWDFQPKVCSSADDNCLKTPPDGWE